MVAPGTYDIATAITVNKSLTIAGVAGQPRPRLVGRAGVARTLALDPVTNNTLRHLGVESQATNGVAVRIDTGPSAAPAGVTVEDVVASASGSNATAIQLFLTEALSPAVVRDSTARTTGSGSRAILVGRQNAGSPDVTFNIRNVTADARGSDSVGITARGAARGEADCANQTVDVRNAVALGTRADFAAEGYYGTCLSTVNVYSSNWRTGEVSRAGRRPAEASSTRGGSRPPHRASSTRRAGTTTSSPAHPPETPGSGTRCSARST